MLHARQLLRDGAYYSVARIVTGLSFLVVLPIHTRYLDAGDVGVLAMTGAVSAFLTHVAMLGLDNASIRFFFRMDADDQKAAVFSTFYFMYVGALVAAATLVAIVSTKLSLWLFGHAGAARFLTLACASLPFLGSIIVLQNWLKANERPKATAVMAAAQGLLLALSTWLLVGVFGMGLVGAYAANLVTLSIMAAAAVYTMRAVLWSHRVDMRVARDMLVFSWPMVPALLAGWTATQADRLLLGKVRSLEDAGVYHVAAFTGTAVAALIGGIAAAFGPAALRNAANPEFRRHAADAVAQLSTVWGAIAFVAACLAPEIVWVLGGTEFHQAALLIAPIVFAQVIAGSSSLISVGPVIAMSNWPSSLAIMTTAGATLTANVVLIPQHGGWGAAIAQLIGQLSGFAVMVTTARRIYPVPYALPMMTIKFAAWLVLGFMVSLTAAPLIVRAPLAAIALAMGLLELVGHKAFISRLKTAP
jgi:O-antigen/teichoic acid export membrane protein